MLAHSPLDLKEVISYLILQLRRQISILHRRIDFVYIWLQISRLYRQLTDKYRDLTDNPRIEYNAWYIHDDHEE